MKEEVFNAIKGRRSIRAFRGDKPVSREDLNLLLESAIWAPSAGNLQPWRFYVVEGGDLKKRLARAAFGQNFIAQAPLIIVVCALPAHSAIYYGRRGEELYCIQDTAAAVQNILLMAHAIGLGTCWIGAFSEAMAGEALSLPEGERPVAMIPVGYPRESPSPRKRRSTGEVTEFL